MRRADAGSRLTDELESIERHRGNVGAAGGRQERMRGRQLPPHADDVPESVIEVPGQQGDLHVVRELAFPDQGRVADFHRERSGERVHLRRGELLDVHAGIDFGEERVEGLPPRLHDQVRRLRLRGLRVRASTVATARRYPFPAGTPINAACLRSAQKPFSVPASTRVRSRVAFPSSSATPDARPPDIRGRSRIVTPADAISWPTFPAHGERPLWTSSPFTALPTVVRKTSPRSNESRTAIPGSLPLNARAFRFAAARRATVAPRYAKSIARIEVFIAFRMPSPNFPFDPHFAVR